MSSLCIVKCQSVQYYYNGNELIYDKAVSECAGRDMVLAQPKTQDLWKQLSDFLSPMDLR